MVTIGERIHQLRLERGWSQTDLAERAHIHPSHIGKIERGERVNMSVRVLDDLATALEYPLFDLLADVGLGQQLSQEEVERWQRDLIRAFAALPPALKESQLETMLMLAAECRRRRAELDTREPPGRQVPQEGESG